MSRPIVGSIAVSSGTNHCQRWLFEAHRARSAGTCPATRKMCYDIVLTVLAFHHRHMQRVQMPPAGLQAAPVMAVSSELVRISRATECTAPIDHTWLAAHPAGTTFG